MRQNIIIKSNHSTKNKIKLFSQRLHFPKSKGIFEASKSNINNPIHIQIHTNKEQNNFQNPN